AEMDGYRFERAYLAPTATPHLSIALTAARLVGRARSHDLVHVHGEAAATLCLPSLATRPSVVTFHGLHLLRRVDGPAKQAAKLNVRLILAAASRAICVSHAEHDHLLAAVGRAPNATVIPNAVRPLEPASAEERETARAELG